MAEKGSMLTLGQRLSAGDSLLSPLGNFRLLMQLNGNLVIYARSNQSVVWQSHTTGAGNWALLQSDGNFVVYDPAGSLPMWNSETGRVNVSAERFIALQDDSNLVIYDPLLAPVWSSLGGSIL
ncbi:hypothetical protein [Aquirhabdus sp.]|uniref:hypothetical protein n=1 Tax=Aquirhabdus sp. TaxID=2824160 RepID=UPI00396CA727